MRVIHRNGVLPASSVFAVVSLASISTSSSRHAVGV